MNNGSNYKVHPVRYFTMYGEKFAVHRNVYYIMLDDEYEYGEEYTATHYATGMGLSLNENSIEDAIASAKKLLRENKKDNVLKAIDKCKIINHESSTTSNRTRPK